VVKPEGSPFGEADLASIVEEAKASGLTKAQAQALLESRATVVNTLAREWLAEAQADPEIGGERFTDTVTKATAGVEWMFPNPEVRQAMKDWFTRTALGNHKEFIRAMSRLGAALQEDRPLTRAGGDGQPDLKSTADVLFGATSK
jgi:hypothetical protein